MTQKRKKAEIDARMLTQEITELQAQIKPITPDVADKVDEISAANIMKSRISSMRSRDMTAA